MRVEACCQRILSYTLPIVDENREGICIDVGVGTFAFYCEMFAMLGFKTVAVEPLPVDGVRVLCRYDGITLIEACLSDVNGTKTIHLGNVAAGLDSNYASLEPDWFGVSTETREVQSLTLSKLLLNFNAEKVSCLKLDIEGAESTVIKTFRELPKAWLPSIVMFEYGGWSTRATGQNGWSPKFFSATMECLKALKECGYGFSVMVDNALDTEAKVFDLQTSNLEPDNIFYQNGGYGNIITFRTLTLPEEEVRKISSPYYEITPSNSINIGQGDKVAKIPSSEESEVYKFQLHLLRQELEQYKGELQQLRSQSESQLHQTKAELEQSQSQLHQTKAELEQSQSQLHQTKAELEQSQSQLHQTQAELEQSQSQLHQTQEVLEQFQDQIQKAETLLQEYQIQLHQTQGELEQSQSQLHQTQAGLEQSQSQLHQTQGELEQTQSQLHQTQSELRESKEELGEFQAIAEQFQEQLHQAHAVLEQSQGKLHETQTELAQTKSQLYQSQWEEERSRFQLHQTQAELEQSRSKYQDLLAVSESTRKDWVDKLAQSESKLAEAQSQYLGLKSLQKLETENSRLISQIHSIQEELEVAHAQIERLKTDVERIELQSYQIQTDGEKDRLQYQLMATQEELEKAQFNVQILTQESEKWKITDQERIKLEEQLIETKGELEKERIKLEEQLTETKGELDMARSQGQTLADRLEMLQQQLVINQTELDNYKVQLQNTQGELENLRLRLVSDLMAKDTNQNDQSKYKILVSEGWYAYQSGDLKKMQQYLQESLKLTPISRTESVINWLESFAKFSSEKGDYFDSYALTNSPEWKHLVGRALAVKHLAQNARVT